MAYTFSQLHATWVIVLVWACQYIVQGTPLVSQNGVPVKSEKQGILEIPKQAVSVIRNFIDKNLETYLHFTTPTPDPRKPDSIANSIVGHYLLANFYSTPAPARPYSPDKTIVMPVFSSNEPSYVSPPPYDSERHKNVIKPIFNSNEPTYIGHSEQVAPSATSEFVSKVNEAVPVTTQRSRPRRTRPSEKPPHILDTDTSFNGIYNGDQLQTVVPPTAAPPAQSGLFGTFEVEEHNTIDNIDEVYWIDPTKPSVVFPIETSIRPRETTTTEEGDGLEIIPESETERSTTPDEDDENEDTLLRIFETKENAKVKILER